MGDDLDPRGIIYMTDLLPLALGTECSLDDHDDEDLLQAAWSSFGAVQRQELCQQLVSDRNAGSRTAYIDFKAAVRSKTSAQSKIRTQKAIKKPKQMQMQYRSLPYPTDLTRCSPFFPVPYVRRSEQAKILPYLNDWPLAKNSWGVLTYKGPTLTTAHEDLLVALLALVNTHEGDDPCTYSGSMRELLVAAGSKRPNGLEYDDAFDQLADLAGAVVSVLNTKGKRIAFSSLITGGRREEDNFRISLNPEFARAHKEGQISYQDLRLRGQIRSLVGKALYRFMAGQSGVWKGGAAVLSGALNIECDKAGRRKLRVAIEELVSLQILKKGSGLDGKTVVLIPGKSTK